LALVEADLLLKAQLATQNRHGDLEQEILEPQLEDHPLTHQSHQLQILVVLGQVINQLELHLQDLEQEAFPNQIRLYMVQI